MLNNTQTFILLLMIMISTIITRFLPFWVFPANKPVPPIVLRLGKVIAPAMMGLLLVFCLKNLTIHDTKNMGITVVALAVIALLHTRFRNALLSIGGGTAVYVVLLRML